MSAELQHKAEHMPDPFSDDDEELVDEIDFREPTWMYPETLCKERGFLKYRIMRCKTPWPKTGKTRYKFYFYKDSDKIANCSYDGVQCESRKGKKFWSVLA